MTGIMLGFFSGGGNPDNQYTITVGNSGSSWGFVTSSYGSYTLNFSSIEVGTLWSAIYNGSSFVFTTTGDFYPQNVFATLKIVGQSTYLSSAATYTTQGGGKAPAFTTWTWTTGVNDMGTTVGATRVIQLFD